MERYQFILICGFKSASTSLESRRAAAGFLWHRPERLNRILGQFDAGRQCIPPFRPEGVGTTARK